MSYMKKMQVGPWFLLYLENTNIFGCNIEHTQNAIHTTKKVVYHDLTILIYYILCIHTLHLTDITYNIQNASGGNYHRVIGNICPYIGKYILPPGPGGSYNAQGVN